MARKKGNQSSWYTSKGGNVFHALGNNMSDKTIQALGALADAAKKMIETTCPNCGAEYGHGLEFKDRTCQCGWIKSENE